jgi:hypothetical protein
MTDLPLEKLIEIVNDMSKFSGCDGGCGCGFGHNSAISIGAAANEIGVMFVLGDQEAENPLAKMLADQSWMAPCGYFYLCQKRDNVSPETAKLLDQFKKDPRNAGELEQIKARIAELAAKN